MSDLVQGDVDSLVYDDLSKRVRCSTCTLKDKNQDRWIIAAVVALLVGFFPAYLIQWILEGLLNANIGGIGRLTIFTIIFIPAIIYIKKMMG